MENSTIRTPDGAWITLVTPDLCAALKAGGIEHEVLYAKTKAPGERRWTNVNLISWKGNIMADENEVNPEEQVMPDMALERARLRGKNLGSKTEVGGVKAATPLDESMDEPPEELNCVDGDAIVAYMESIKITELAAMETPVIQNGHSREHKLPLTWELFEKLENRRDKFKQEYHDATTTIATLQTENRRLELAHVELTKDNDRLKDANATYAASLSPTGGANIGAGEVLAAKDEEIEKLRLNLDHLKIQYPSDTRTLLDRDAEIKDLRAQLEALKAARPAMTTTEQPAIGVYEYRGMVTEQDGRQGKWWFQPEQNGDKVKSVTGDAMIIPGTPATGMAALTPRQQLAVEQNAEVVRVIFDTMNTRSVARIAQQEKLQ